MNLIALKDFRNVRTLKLSITGAKHPDHVHKGARFKLGPETSNNTIEELNAADDVIAQSAAKLIAAGVAAPADDKTIAAVEKEIEQDAKREEQAAKLNEKASLSHLGSAALEAMKSGKK